MFLLSLIIASNALIVAMSLDQVLANTQNRSAKWQAPDKAAGSSKKQKKTSRKNNTAAKKSPTKTKQAAKKASISKDIKKDPKKGLVNTSLKKDAPEKKAKTVKPEGNTLIVDQDFQDNDYDALSEERSTSPLLIVFVTFVVCCVSGMLFLNQRRKQLEAARVKFQETTSHDLAFISNEERLESSHPTHSGHETPTTRTLFERPDERERSSAKSSPKMPGLFEKISSKAASLIKSGKGTNGNQKKVKEFSMHFDNEDLNAGSIATISAVKSEVGKATSKPPIGVNPDTTVEPLPASMGAEPCSFESYTEIQIAAQCWHAQKLSLDAKLRSTFNIDTTTLIQYEFYWKQKISNNVNLKKKYHELEPLYTAKYETAS
jgi:hypothetical protein